MLHALLSMFALFGQAQEGVVTHVIDTGNPNISVMVRDTRLDPSRKSPKKFQDGMPWEFDWLTTGFGNLGEKGVLALRLRVYSQERKGTNDKAPMVARMVMQIWDRSIHRLKLDNPQQYNNSIVDFFLCFGGDPGGEQIFDYVPGLPPHERDLVPVNTIYIYRLDTFKDPIEMAREVAHEYGHAILPGVGGFKQPEAWGNGYLGEKLFLKWIRDDMAAGKLKPEDAMGASLSGLNSWVANNVDKLVTTAAIQFPDPNLINETKGGMEAFDGLAMYVEEMCPPAVFLRSLYETRDAHRAATDMTPPTDYAQNVVVAASAVENLTLAVPDCVKNQKTIWIPLGKGTISGATVISRKNGWAQVAPLMPNIVIKNPPLQANLAPVSYRLQMHRRSHFWVE